MWIACTNRDTIRVAARNGFRALAFSFVDPEEGRRLVAPQDPRLPLARARPHEYP
jgi:hypothetical protein